MYIVKGFLLSFPIVFSMGLLLILVVFFSVVIRICENGYLRFINRADFGSQ